MTVAVIAPGPAWATGGVEKSAARLIGYLEEWGSDWRVICRRADGTSPADWRVLQIKTAPKQLGRMAFGWKAAQHVLRMNPDVIHVHGAEYGWALGLSRTLSRLMNRDGRWHARAASPVLVTVHGSLQASLKATSQGSAGLRSAVHRLLQRPVGVVESAVLRHAHEIVCDSERARQQIHRFYGIPSEMMSVIPNAIDDVFFVPSRTHAPRSRGRLLWVGRDAADKDLDGALSVFAAIKSECDFAQLLMVGPSQRSAPRDVHFLSGKNPREMADIYCRSRLLLSTSLYESDPLTVKEAMACGTPVLVTEAASATVQDGRNGLVCRESVSTTTVREELVRKAVRLLRDDALWTRLSEGAWASREGFRAQREERAYRKIYERLVSVRPWP